MIEAYTDMHNLIPFPDLEEVDLYISKHPYTKIRQLTEKAHDILFTAYSTKNTIKLVDGLQKAVQTSPLCSDAYLMLTDLFPCSPRDKLHYCEGAAYIASALMDLRIENNDNPFEDDLFNKQYIRAQTSYARHLAIHHEHFEAASIFELLLTTEPIDSAGVRYDLLKAYFHLADFDKAEQLLKTYHDDQTCIMSYSRALLAHIKKKRNKNILLKTALSSNAHVSGFFDGTYHIEKKDEAYAIFGGVQEASDYVEGFYRIWLSTPKAIQWLLQYR